MRKSGASSQRHCFRPPNASAIIALVARQVPNDAVIEALGHVKYPGYSADIVALGLVEDAQPTPNGGFSNTNSPVTPRGAGISVTIAHIPRELTDIPCAARHRRH